MIRKSAGTLVLLFVAGFAIASQDKKDAKKVDYATEIGNFESYKDEKLTLKVEGKKKEFKVPADTPVAYSTGKKDDKIKTFKAKENLKDVKKGSFVAVTLDSDGKKVLGVGVVVSELPADKRKGDEEKTDK